MGTRVEARERTQYGNRGGSEDEVASGAGTETRKRAQDGNGSGEGNEGSSGDRNGYRNRDGALSGDGNGSENGEGRGKEESSGIRHTLGKKQSRTPGTAITHAASSLLTGGGVCR